MKALLPIFYLPPISWFAEFLDAENEIILEKFENFPKQTYRSRCTISVSYTHLDVYKRQAEWLPGKKGNFGMKEVLGL